MATITLSTLDSNAPQDYHRYALIFGCSDDDMVKTMKNLHDVVKKTVSELPVLAGKVIPGENGKMQIDVTLEQINSYEVNMVQVNTSHAELCREKIAPRLLFKESMTPLADTPAHHSAPASAMQANFLANGLVLVIYLHHKVADIHGIRTVLRLMSEGLPGRQLTEHELFLECEQASTHRERLSSSEGAPDRLARSRLASQLQQYDSGQAAVVQQQILQQQQPNAVQGQHPARLHQAAYLTNKFTRVTTSAKTASAVLSFKLRCIQNIRSMVNDRRDNRRQFSSSRGLLGDGNVNDEQVLLAIVWKAIVRAKFPKGSLLGKENTSLSFPVYIRKVLDPELESGFFGNAQITAFASASINDLGLEYDMDRIYNATNAIMGAVTKAASDLQVRSQIALFNKPFESMTLDTEAVGNDKTNTGGATETGDITNPPADYVATSFSVTYPSADSKGGNTPTPASALPVGSPGDNIIGGGRSAPIPIPRAGGSVDNKGKAPASTTDDSISDSDSDTVTGPNVDLGLGLGNADAVRRIGRTIAANEIIILPLNRARDAWEVQVELEEAVLNEIFKDDSLTQRFIWDIAH